MSETFEAAAIITVGAVAAYYGVLRVYKQNIGLHHSPDIQIVAAFNAARYACIAVLMTTTMRATWPFSIGIVTITLALHSMGVRC